MKRNTVKKALLLVVVGLLGVLGLALAERPASTLSPEAKAAILEALTGPEGEYAAYAAYTAVIEKYGEVEPYTRIRQAEARHIEALKRLLDRYGVDYPEENPYLGKVEAPASLEDAARAWAEGEVKNVAMYDRLIAAVADYPDAVRVFEHLRQASEAMHLPAFRAAAENGGTLTLAQMQALGQGHKEHGKGGCQGPRGGRQGKGPGYRHGSETH